MKLPRHVSFSPGLEGSPWNGMKWVWCLSDSQLVRSRPGEFLGTNWWFGELTSNLLPGWTCGTMRQATELPVKGIRKATVFWKKHDHGHFTLWFTGLPMKGQSSFGPGVGHSLDHPKTMLRHSWIVGCLAMRAPFFATSWAATAFGTASIDVLLPLVGWLIERFVYPFNNR